MRKFLRNLSMIFEGLSWIAFRPKHWLLVRLLGKSDYRNHLFGQADVDGVSYCKICSKSNKDPV